MYLYQKTNRYFAQVADDIKDIAEQELLNLGAINTSPIYRGIHFTSTAKNLYRINYHTRLINRILAPLISFKCHSDKYLYKTASQIKWQDFLDPSMSFAVFASVSHSNIKHSKFAALRLKDAIVDTFRSHTGKRPSVATKDPDVWMNLHIENNNAIISLDTSGGSLHRRGYRRKTTSAPMIETLAAAIIHHSGWNGRTPLYDPFCGSGTLLCEAYMLATKTPASVLRKKFGFVRLPDYKTSVWNKLKENGIQERRSISADLIAGSDILLEAVEASKYNSALIDKFNHIKIIKQDVFQIESLKGKTIICNPPYGIRMEKNTDLGGFYKQFGDFLKQRCMGSTAYVYFGERKYIKHIGLKPSWKKPLSNGGLDGRLVKYQMY